METYGELHVHKVGERMTRYRTTKKSAQQESSEISGPRFRLGSAQIA